MRELDQPATTHVQAESAPVEECGEPMMGGMPPMAPPAAPHNPPSLSVNLTAQGMDDIESIMKLMTKVNPDMINQPMGAPVAEPMLTPPGPSISSIGDLGNLDAGPLKMLPDFDAGNDDAPGGEADIEIDLPGADEAPGGDPIGASDGMSKAQGDLDNDGDHDMHDHEMEKDKPEDSMDKPGDDAMNKGDEEEQKKDEGWSNSPVGMGVQDSPEVKDVDYMVNKISGGMGKQQAMYKHNYRGGDNPMAMKEGDLRAYIKAGLAKHLAEAKEKSK